jgi:hypothetical protein
MTTLEWRPGKQIERAVTCCNCGSTIAIAESRVAGPKLGPCVFSCCEDCEREYEASEKGRRFAKRLADIKLQSDVAQ